MTALTRQDAARELLRRARARDSLHSYALSIDLPTVGVPGLMLDEDILGPAENLMARHHAKILEVLERTVKRDMGRCLIMAPPGTAKSLYTSVLLPTWVMGRQPGARIILTSYASKLAEKQSRRAIQIAESEKYRMLWPETPTVGRDAVGDWSIKWPDGRESEMMAAGLTAGLTGNRADGAIIDDPVAGREEADSEVERQNVFDAYSDDLKTRLLPGAWLALILTRWHEDDLAGRILPDDYAGQSGMVRCKDGLDWEVLNLPAKSENHDDPLGRAPGVYIWPEYYKPKHWHQFEFAKGSEAGRTWSSLYQQRPSPQGSGRFNEGMFDYYEEGSAPPVLAYVGGSDFAVTEGGGDFTEHGVFGVDTSGDLWELDWYSEQTEPGRGIEEMLDRIVKWKTPMWFNEGGIIDKSVRPQINRRMRERGVLCDIRSMPSMKDKLAKCASFQAMAAAGGDLGNGNWQPGRIHFRDNANSRRVVAQLVALPAGRRDDGADVCGLIGRAIDQFPSVCAPQFSNRQVLKPFTAAWIEWKGEDEKPKVRYR